jgi:hypothetical protein
VPEPTLLDAAFTTAAAAKRPALVGYLPAGYPTVRTSLAALRALVQHVDVIELGIPRVETFAAPLHRRAARAALDGGATPVLALDLIRRLTTLAPCTPVLLNPPAALVSRYTARSCSLPHSPPPAPPASSSQTYTPKGTQPPAGYPRRRTPATHSTTYLLAPIPPWYDPHRTGEDWRTHVLRRSGVLPGEAHMTTPGHAPQPTAGWVRIHLGQPAPVLAAALDRIAAAGLGWRDDPDLPLPAANEVKW